MGGVTGGRSKVTIAGSRQGKSGAMLPALGWEEGLSQQCEAREAGAESPLRCTIVLGRRVQVVQAH